MLTILMFRTAGIFDIGILSPLLKAAARPIVTGIHTIGIFCLSHCRVEALLLM